ncbi:3' exoribonuclease [Diaporthe helianthi]|uniref:Ribosomal RNA-processing protein 43 n=1 Tax=Diaporthe helianthi TaxID=158607 RepID=A0A2P5HY78_DIAHE|nr:3' exoribonuclease [Diaporthe helianthi]
MTSSTTFTPQTFAKLSPHPFLLANLEPPSHAAAAKPTRTNGRAPHQARPLNINASSLSHAHGSAMVRVGDTSVICGVRGELLPTTSIPHWRRPKSKAELEAGVDDTDAELRDEGARELRDYDLLVPNIELATGCAPQFLPGVPPTTLAQTLSTRVYSLLHSTALLDSEDLRVWYTPPSLELGEDERMVEGEDEGNTDDNVAEPEVKAYWVLYIDVLFVSFDGNPFDAAWFAVLAALRDTKLPRAWWDPDREMVLCSRTESRALSVRGLPIACTAALLNEREAEIVGQSKSFVLVDPDRLEESLCDESITVVVDCTTGETRIRGISKSGGRVLGPKDIREMAGMAESRWEDVQHALA